MCLAVREGRRMEIDLRIDLAAERSRLILGCCCCCLKSDVCFFGCAVVGVSGMQGGARLRREVGRR